MKTPEIKDKAELVTAAQIAGATPEAKEFWDGYRERVRIREAAEKRLVEPRKNKHL